MTKDEVVELLKEGKKITHRYFTPEEYVYQKDGKIFDEKDYCHTQFWQIRRHESWNTGWGIYNEIKP